MTSNRAVEAVLAEGQDVHPVTAAATDDRRVRLNVVARHRHQTEVRPRSPHDQPIHETRVAALLVIQVAHLHREDAVSGRGEVPAGVARQGRETQLADVLVGIVLRKRPLACWVEHRQERVHQARLPFADHLDDDLVSLLHRQGVVIQVTRRAEACRSRRTARSASGPFRGRCSAPAPARSGRSSRR